MRLVPNYISEGAPTGEKRVFNILKSLNDKKYEKWVVYHSLNYPVHIQKKDKTSFQYFGETDFLIFNPDKGLINIEIKGGRISVEDGTWYTENRSGKSKLKKSPFVQATDSMKNIERYLNKQFLKIPQDFLVIFPDCDFDKDSIEWSKDNFCSGQVDQFLEKKILTLEKKLTETGGRFYPSLEDQKKLKNIFRSNFESFQSYHTLLKQSLFEINKFTDEQINILDQFETNRMLIEGSQGTGKTVLAIEIAKKKIFEGKKVLFLNSNRLASENIINKFKDFNQSDLNQITINTFSSFIFKRAHNYFSKSSHKDEKYIIADQGDFHYKHNILTGYVLDKSIEDEALLQYDCIILDEIQNYYFYENFYDLLDCLLKDGLSKGSWYFFGDFDFQKLFTINENLSEEFLEKKHPKNNLKDYGYYNQRLTHNVRNAYEICIQSPIISNVTDKHPSIYRNTTGEVHHHFAEKKENEIQILKDLIEKLYKNRIDGNDITVLSPFRLENDKNLLKHCDISKFYSVLNLNKVNNFGEEIVNENKNSIYFSTIQYFQGRENKIIILTDPMLTSFGTSETIEKIKNKEPLDQRYPENFLTFNAMGRANSILYVIWNKIFEKYVSQKIAKSISLIK